MITPATTDDLETLIDLWERSARATHNFLSEDDIAFYRERILSDYFNQVELWIYQEQRVVKGFIGIGEMIEMLFVDPRCFRQGIGTALLDFAVTVKGMRQVDVNEQNQSAQLFYKSKGFVKVGCSEIDGDGRPYPIIHLALP